MYSGSQDDSNAFNLFKNLQTMRACFCGHDHVNDYGGVLDGIELVYGRATGYGGYGGDYVDKGGKLITVNLRNPAIILIKASRLNRLPGLMTRNKLLQMFFN